MEDNAPVHKGVCCAATEIIGCEAHPHPLNSPDLNPIENIWAHIKYRLTKDYPFVTARKELEIIITRIYGREFGLLAREAGSNRVRC